MKQELLALTALGLMALALSVAFVKACDDKFVERAVSAGYYCSESFDKYRGTPKEDGYACINGKAVKGGSYGN